MIIGRRWWILIWWGILLTGAVGLAAAFYWARQTRWRNLDEMLRAGGTILVSAGMLLLLYELSAALAQLALLTALLSFVLAFILGRRADRAEPRPRTSEHDEGDEVL
jgi:uncharacterized membrane protein YfcA